ncbi:hypothetical protein DMW52_00560 [Serratia marcescens]|uniref:hypothetical protein n=1 Tax=Serratia marcescens TaxID=615 RepID=UPI000D906DBE|nr:hypothetical protein [Serratia marcescens]PYA64474.1 hypothetical protein DMW52_00560 [Serratia marcescens]
MAQLTIAVECTYPSEEEINTIYKAVESEFFGLPFDEKNVIAFMRTVRERVMDKILVVVKNETQGITVSEYGRATTDQYFGLTVG